MLANRESIPLERSQQIKKCIRAIKSDIRLNDIFYTVFGIKGGCATALMTTLLAIFSGFKGFTVGANKTLIAKYNVLPDGTRPPIPCGVIEPIKNVCRFFYGTFPTVCQDDARKLCNTETNYQNYMIAFGVTVGLTLVLCLLLLYNKLLSEQPRPAYTVREISHETWDILNTISNNENLGITESSKLSDVLATLESLAPRQAQYGTLHFSHPQVLDVEKIEDENGLKL